MKKHDNVESISYLSPAQFAMLMESVLEPGRGLHIEQVVMTLRGELDESCLCSALECQMERHPITRTVFVYKAQKEPLQVVFRRVPLPMERYSWRTLPESDRSQALHAFLGDDRRRGFIPSRPGLMRFTLLELESDHHELIWTYHHLIMDGWSTALFVQQLFDAYCARTSGRLSDFSPPPPFSTYVEFLRTRDERRARKYWRRTLKDMREPTRLDLFSADPSREQEVCDVQTFVPADTTTALRTVARSHRLTLNTIVQGIWAALLECYSGCEHVVFGTTVTDRPSEIEGIEGTVGSFISTLPFRTSVPGTTSMCSWLAQVQNTHLELREFAHCTPGQILGWSNLDKALFESVLVFQNYPSDWSRLGNDHLQVKVQAHGARTRYPLILLVGDASELSLRLFYHSDRMDKMRAQKISNDFRRICTAFANSPNDSVYALQARAGVERRTFAVSTDDVPQARTSRSPVEEILSGLWSRVLKLSPKDHTRDTFVSLGGHSLLMAQIVSQANKTFGVDLSLGQAINAISMSEMARIIEDARCAHRRGSAAPIVPLDAHSARLPSVGQLETWRQLQASNRLAHPQYVVQRMRFAHTTLDLKIVESAFSRVCEHCDTLRTVFAEDGTPRTASNASLAPRVEFIDLSGCSDNELGLRLSELALSDAITNLSIDHAPMAHLRLVRLTGERSCLLLTLHRLIGDGRSAAIVLEEVLQICTQSSIWKESLQSLGSLEYAAFAAWQREWLQGTAMDAQMTYWKKRIRTPLISKQDATVEQNSSWSQPHHALSLGGADVSVQILDELGRNLTLNRFAILAAALHVAMYKSMGIAELVIWTTFHGRLRAELDRVVGPFENTLPLYSALSEESSFSDFAQRVRDEFCGAHEHQDVPVMTLRRGFPDLDELGPCRAAVHVDLEEEEASPPCAVPGNGIGNWQVPGVGSRWRLATWNGRIHGIVTYDDRIFTQNEVECVDSAFGVVLEHACAKPSETLAGLLAVQASASRDSTASV